MASRLHFPPFLHEVPVFVDQECAPNNTHHLLSVHILLFDHVVRLAGLFFRVREERDREGVAADEVLVALFGVARDTDHVVPELPELRNQSGEFLRFCSTAGGAVLRIVESIYIDNQ